MYGAGGFGFNIGVYDRVEMVGGFMSELKTYEVIIPIKESWVFRVRAKTKDHAVWMADSNYSKEENELRQICSTGWQDKITVREVENE